MRDKDRVILCPRGFQYAASIAFGKIILRPHDVGHATFLGQDLSDPLIRIRLGLYHRVVEHTYVEDFASVVGICRCACNTTEASEDPLPIRVERLGGRLFPAHALTRGRDKAEDIFQSSEIGDLHFLRTRSRVAASSGTESPIWRASSFTSS